LCCTQCASQAATRSSTRSPTTICAQRGQFGTSASNPTPFATDHSDARSSRKASAKLTTIVVPVKKKFTSACDHLS